MLADKDRIFTNLYGFQDVGLEGAKKRGQWDNTKAILELGPEGIVDIMKKSGPARARRRGFPHRPQMVLHAQGGEGAAALSGGQCR
jgi:NADH-quinone oxidoreductase subunit F